MAHRKRAFASITRIASGRWQVRYTGPDGIRRYAPHTFDTQLAAEAWAVKLRKQIDADRWQARQPERITFAAYATQWLSGRQVAGRPIKTRTREHYADLLETHLLPAFGARSIGAIRPKDVRDWYAQTLVDKPTMRAHAYSLLKAIMATAVADELVESNPCRIVGAGRAARAQKITPATVAELAVITAAMPERLALMVTLAAWCALRYGEVTELRRGDVDLAAEVVHIRRAVVHTRDGALIGTPKSAAGVRDVVMPPHIVAAVTDHLAKHVGLQLDSWLFEANRGGHLQPGTFNFHWYRARSAAGRDDLKFHHLRHTGAVLAAQAGATVAELQAMLGHSSPAMAMKYQHAARGRDREIAALLSKMVDDTGSNVSLTMT